MCVVQTNSLTCVPVYLREQMLGRLYGTHIRIHTYVDINRPSQYRLRCSAGRGEDGRKIFNTDLLNSVSEYRCGDGSDISKGIGPRQGRETRVWIFGLVSAEHITE